MPKKERVDVTLVERGLVESRNMAQRLIMAGQVRAEGEVVMKSSLRIDADTALTIDRGPRFVSRGGEKLAAALAAFSLSVDGMVCADVGASTGGFTDCLLQNGARRVHAIDVGQGLIHWRLRQDDRVILMERSNARYLEWLPEPIDLATIDVSFISLRQILPVVRGWLKSTGQVISLVKPQFEAGREMVGRGGVVREPLVHRQVLNEVMQEARKIGLFPSGLIRSPLLGPKGNIEFLLWLLQEDAGTACEELIQTAVA
jgi:23S rRNA (cytidine1920-2'-O)/16S rRNA (cytidine1409-2'-O)-methyltransferase